jgi:hypothetical protein
MYHLARSTLFSEGDVQSCLHESVVGRKSRGAESGLRRDGDIDGFHARKVESLASGDEIDSFLELVQNKSSVVSLTNANQTKNKKKQQKRT